MYSIYRNSTIRRHIVGGCTDLLYRRYVWWWRATVDVRSRFLVPLVSQTCWSHHKKNQRQKHPPHKEHKHIPILILRSHIGSGQFSKALIVGAVLLRRPQNRKKAPHRPLMAANAFTWIKVAHS